MLSTVSGTSVIFGGRGLGDFKTFVVAAIAGDFRAIILREMFSVIFASSLFASLEIVASRG